MMSLILGPLGSRVNPNYGGHLTHRLGQIRRELIRLFARVSFERNKKEGWNTIGSRWQKGIRQKCTWGRLKLPRITWSQASGETRNLPNQKEYQEMNKLCLGLTPKVKPTTEFMNPLFFLSCVFFPPLGKVY